MSYIAETYPFIAEQLLTSLTGGMAREVHTFLPQSNAVGFGFEWEADDIINTSLVVGGQSREKFVLFTQNRDYELTPQGRIQFFASDDFSEPDGNAQWPDEGSEFYVSYYHKESYKSLITDRNVGSLNRTLSESYARELAVLRKQMEKIYRSGFVATAEGDSLDKVVALLGLSRKNREHASGKVRFYRNDPAPADVYIPVGTKVSTNLNPPVTFVSTTSKTLRRGQLSVEIDVMAEEKGMKGVVAAGVIEVINQSILGISAVTNDAPTLFGAEKESDPSLRARATHVMERVGKATPRAMKLALTSLGGIQENDVKIVEELALRPGVVKVYVAGSDPTNSTLRANILDGILNSRPAGIRVEHNLETALPDSESLVTTVSTEDAGDAEWEAVETPEGEDFLIPLSCDVLVFPTNLRLEGSEKNNLKIQIETAVAEFMESLSIGGYMVYNQLIHTIMGTAGIADVNVSVKLLSDSSTIIKRNIKAPEGRRLELSPQNLRVHFSGEVFFDFHFFVTPQGDSTIESIRSEIAGKLSEYFVTQPTEISAANILLYLSGSSLYFADPADVTWSVEFDNSGLILQNQGGADKPTSVPTGDVALIRNLSVEVKS